MDRQKKQLFLALGILVLLTAAWLGLRAFTENAPEENEEEQSYAVSDFNAEKVTQVAYQGTDLQYTFQKQDDKWICTQEPSLEVSSEKVVSLINTLSQLEASQKIERVDDLAQYGLAEPLSTVTVTADQESTVYTIGDRNSMTGQYYLRINEEPDIYTMDEQLIGTLQQQPADFAEEETTEEQKVME